MRLLVAKYASLITSMVISSMSGDAQKKIQVENITDGTFREQSVRSLNWMNDGQYYSALSDNKIIKYSVRTGEEVEIIVNGNDLNLEIDDYNFSDDESVVLIMTERESVYRRSYTAVFYLFDRAEKAARKLSDGKQSYATLSPDNTKAAFTRDNNLFYTDLESKEETAVTTDGKFNAIINGSTDWVYEEELYLTKAFEWSPDSKRLAYYRFDESDVREYNMQLWNEGALYPEDYRYKYPKAGEANAAVEIYLYDLASKAKTKADIGTETDIYIPRINWTKNPEMLAVRRLNRLQNQLDILHINVKDGSSTVILTDKSDTYVDFTFCDELIYLDNGEQFLFSSEKDGFKHFYLYDIDGSPVSRVTKGEFEAVSLAGLDQEKEKLYYVSTENSPLERHLYVVSLSGKGKRQLTSAEGYHGISMSTDCSYYMDYHSAASAPGKVSLYQTIGNKLIKVMEENRELAQKVKTYGWVEKEFFTLARPEGTPLNGFLLKPSGFDERNKYPMMIYQYSGPGSQSVSNRWGGASYVWHQYLAQNGCIVAVVDTRGTGYRGEAFKKMTYRQLGRYETQDLIFAAEKLADFPGIDAERIGVWGWSYGGYMAALCILKGNNVFKTAIAVAPVTSWRYYDTIYTERYLQRPQDNPEGYDDNSPNTHADKLKGNFLLVHGTGDDNVHFQNATALQNELIDAGKQFNSYYYPDKAHGLGNRRGHLYQMMTDYIMEKL